MLYNLSDRYSEFNSRISEWVLENLKYSPKLSRENFSDLKSRRLYGFHNPIAFGGHGKDFIFHTIAIKSISRINPKITRNIISNYLTDNIIFQFGSREQIIENCTKLKNGEIDSTFIPYFSKDIVSPLNLIDGVLNGEIEITSQLEPTDKYLIVVKSEKAYSILLLDNSQLEIKRNKIVFDDVKISKKNEIKSINEISKFIDFILNITGLSLASHILGISNSFLDKYKVNDYDDDKLADLILKKEILDLLVYKVAELKSNGISQIKSSILSLRQSINLLESIMDLEDRENYDYPFYYAIKTQLIPHIDKLIIENATHSNSLEDNRTSQVSDDQILRKNIIFDSGNLDDDTRVLAEIIKPFINSENSSDIYGPIESSKVTLSFGLGIGDRDNIKLVENLAKLTFGQVACTLPISEELEWLSTNRTVGISGKSFFGDLYFALGLSGAKQHTEAIKKAKTIIAINEDKHAPIFSISDYGIVGDLMEVLPLLIKHLS